MRILIIHNQLWAHYKSKLFAEIYKSLKADFPGSELLVAQIAPYERSRKGMIPTQGYTYDYPYKLLFDQCLEEIPFFSRLITLLKQFHKFKPSVINITGYFDWAQVFMLFYARMWGVKVVLSSESSSDDHSRSVIKESIKRIIVNSANAYFCFGSSSAHYLESLGVKNERITVKNAAVIDDEIIRYKYRIARSVNAPRNPTFIYVGRLSEEKNLKLLMNAFVTISSQVNPKPILRIVGSGPQEEALKLHGSQHEHIIFEGSYPWYEIPNLLAISDVLVLPSNSEPWGLVVNEAMVCSMPVIVSNKCGCAPDLVKEGINGYTFDPQDQEALEKHLISFIHDPNQIHSMGKASEEIIKPFSARIVADNMVATYNHLSK